MSRKLLAYTDSRTVGPVYAKKAGNWSTKIVLVDDNGKNLVAGIDYYTSILYQYVSDITVLSYYNDPRNPSVAQKSAGATVSSYDCVPAGTEIKVTLVGDGYYTGNKSFTYTVANAPISKASIVANAKVYSGEPVSLSKNDLTVTYNKQAVSPNNYEIVGYSTNTKAGKGSVIAKGVGEFTGFNTIKFTIAPKSFTTAVVK